jgi:hypothetical protein
VRPCHGWAEHLGWRFDIQIGRSGDKGLYKRDYMLEGYCPACGTFLPAKGPMVSTDL